MTTPMSQRDRLLFHDLNRRRLLERTPKEGLVYPTKPPSVDFKVFSK